MAGDVPVCPRGHPEGRVVRDGIQKDGGRPRQGSRCILPGGSYHRFLGVVSRTRATLETCVECENHLAPQEGPAAPAQFEYLIREIAGALVDVGRGTTYTHAARRVRMQATVNTPGKLPRHVKNGQTVAEWVADFAPVVSAPHAPTMWPKVLVLDSTMFWWHATGENNRKTPLYSILAAYGYDENGRNGRLWRLEAHPTRMQAHVSSSSLTSRESRCRSLPTRTPQSAARSEPIGAPISGGSGTTLASITSARY
jgi:hypothetical protein